MKPLLALPLAAAGFAAGWFFADPGDAPSRAEQPTTQAHTAANDLPPSAEDSAQRQTVEAMYRAEQPSTPEERLALFESIRTNDEPSLGRELELSLLIQSMDEADLIALYEELNSNNAYLYQIAKRWAALNPLGAIQYCREHADSPGIDRISRQVMRSVYLEDQALAYQALELFPVDERRAILYQIGEGIINQAPALALPLLLQDPSHGQKYSFNRLFDEWAEQDPDAAWAALASLPPGDITQQAYQGLFRHLTTLDPNAALARCGEIPIYSLQHRVKQSIYSQWIREDIDGALAALANEPDPTAYLQSWSIAQQAPDKLVAFAQEHLQGKEQDEALQMAVGRLFEKDRQQALDIIAGLPRGKAHEELMKGVISEWAQTNPDEALAWIQQQPDGRLKRQQLASLISEFTRTDLAAAQSLFLTLDKRSQEAAVNELASALVKGNPEQGLQFLDQVPDKSIARKLERQALRSWSRDAPANLFEHLGPERFNALWIGDKQYMLKQYSRISPAEAAAWLPNVTTTDYKDQVELYGAVYFSWFRHDPLEASEYTAALEPGPERDVAVVSLVDSTYKADPVAAIDWLPDIANDKLRKDMAKRIVQNLPKGYNAVDLINGSDLPPAEREALLKMISK